MADPKSISEFNILFDEFRAGLDRRLDALKSSLEDRLDASKTGLEDRLGVFQTLVWTVLAAIGTLILAVGGNYVHVYYVQKEIVTQIGDLKKDVAVVQTKMGTAESALAEIKRSGDQTLALVTRLGTPNSPTPPPRNNLEITAGDGLLIRQFIKTGPITTAAPMKISVGDTLPDSALQPLPADLVAKQPKLKGVRYLIDPENNLIALVDLSGRVFALI